jgi:hypothetical protein
LLLAPDRNAALRERKSGITKLRRFAVAKFHIDSVPVQAGAGRRIAWTFVGPNGKVGRCHLHGAEHPSARTTSTYRGKASQSTF